MHADVIIVEHFIYLKKILYQDNFEHKLNKTPIESDEYVI